MPGAAVHLLPCCFALKSERHERYLRYVHEDGDEMTYGQLQLSGEDAGNPFTRFDSEPSLLHQGLVHIRCRYNRKYWVPRRRGGGWWIVSDAHEPEEDLDSPNCTLIKPIIVTSTVTNTNTKQQDQDDDDDATTTTEPVMTVRFVHAGRGKDTRMTTFSKDDGGTAACMRVVVAGDKDDDTKLGVAAGEDEDALTVFNLARSPRTLPRFVVFKDLNDQYLRGLQTTIQGRHFLQFSARDPGDPTVVHETTYRNGSLLVRNIHLNRYWGTFTVLTSRTNLITASYTPAQLASQPQGQTTALFDALYVNNYFAISTVTGSFVRTVSLLQGGDFTDALGVGNLSITAQSRIRVEEPVLDREIYNVEYRLREARIYDTSVLTMATTAAINDTSRENTKRLRLAYEESEMSTWDATLELKLGYQSRIRAGFPKLGLGATVNISAEFFGAYNWGETMEKKVSHEVEYEVTVPPRTKVTVSLIATRSAVDVPFDYRQRDIMAMDGEARDVRMTDGLYTGINSYNFKFRTTEEKLKPRILAPTPTATETAT